MITRYLNRKVCGLNILFPLYLFCLIARHFDLLYQPRRFFFGGGIRLSLVTHISAIPHTDSKFGSTANGMQGFVLKMLLRTNK